MVATAQVAVQPEDQHRLHAGVVGTPDVEDVTRQLPRWRVVLTAQRADSPNVLVRSGGGHAFGKYAHHGVILLRTFVATYDVIVERRFYIPALILGHFGKVLAPIQSLLFTCHG